MQQHNTVIGGQKGFELKLQMGIALPAVPGTVRILYKKPDGTAAFWTATVSDAATGTIAYVTVATTDIEDEGLWTVNAEWIPNGSTTRRGHPACFYVLNAGSCPR